MSLTVVVALLTVFGPISLDLYLPALPALTADLRTSTSTAQLTITACLIGLAAGQLVAGPISDRFGRRGPALAWVAGYVVTSLFCAISPTVGVLVGARFLQGIAGAGGIVIAQAVGRDLYSGPKLTQYYGRLAVLGGLAAIIGPVLGGLLVAVTDWRGVFVFLAVLGLLILLACAVALTETHPGHARATGGVRQTARDYGRLLRDARFTSIASVVGLVSASLFAYLSGATYVLQDTYGLSPQGYSLAFATNSLGFMIFGHLGGRASGRWGERPVLAGGLVLCTTGAAIVLLSGLVHLPLVGVVAGLFVMVGGVAATSAPSSSLALGDHPQLAGTAAAVLGLSRYALGGIAAPLVGLGGRDLTTALGVVLIVTTVIGAAIFAVLVAGRAPHPGKDGV